MGAALFVVDAGVTLAGARLGLQPWAARIAGYLVAVQISYFINRAFTFQTSASVTRGEWFRYILSQSPAAIANLGASLWLIHTGPARSQLLVVAIALGSLCGLVINFVLARRALRGPAPASAKNKQVS